MKKIGSLTPLWNQELFIKPHFELLSMLDRNVVLMQSGPLPNYHKEHGYSKKPDLSRYLLEEYFPAVEIYEGNYPTTEEFGAELYNEGLRMMHDCDVVMRLDPDMLWTKENFQKFIDYIQTHDADAYLMDFKKDSINYYVTGDFTHGLKDAQEADALAVNPKILFTGILDYPGNPKVIDIEGWMCHHFRGWNKPKSTPANWATDLVSKEYVEEFGGFKTCPDEIRIPLEQWLMELAEIKEQLKGVLT